ncbi:GNAT family N-acetyltransferase [Streptomyces sp. NBC_00557]|uniref:GNAT family N-acetyltransferase n=1 Tax=Streptomyces sp. NBC_00557 TaxID=2975776 RepID=UPI002E805098|nr:GNAT family N-acetyltransferase [Streptomyces sp. NBC_00557]WUC39697.1 hypothetical protein OG956_38720 [Streptomyces sp. NBC_00557]
MAPSEDSLPEEGLSLWLTDWKVPVGMSWTGRRLIACIGRSAAGHLDFHVHPDGQAVKVWMLNVHPGFQRRGLAGVLMDALYAAYPTAWINHGARSPDGARWWNSYRDPAPHRNVHNRPPAEWAAYFDAVEVASEKAQIAHLNQYYGLNGHRDAVYRYGERVDQEADHYTALYQEAPAVRLDPAAQPLHGATRLFLPPSVHAYVHDASQDPAGRAATLLEHLGHGNLPRATYWNTTARAAFEDAHHEELFQDTPPARPATHVVFTLRPLAGRALPAYTALATSVDFTGTGDLAVEIDGLSWRQAHHPHLTHTAALSPAVQAAIAPYSWRHASTAYRARYDEAGFLRTPDPTPATSPQPYAERAAEISAMADRLMQQLASRASKPGPKPAPKPDGAQQQTPPPAPRPTQQPGR